MCKGRQYSSLQLTHVPNSVQNSTAFPFCKVAWKTAILGLILVPSLHPLREGIWSLLTLIFAFFCVHAPTILNVPRTLLCLARPDYPSQRVESGNKTYIGAPTSLILWVIKQKTSQMISKDWTHHFVQFSESPLLPVVVHASLFRS